METKKGEKVFVFQNVPLEKGGHIITVKSSKTGHWEDSVYWERVEEADPTYTCPHFDGSGTVQNWMEQLSKFDFMSNYTKS